MRTVSLGPSVWLTGDVQYEITFCASRKRKGRLRRSALALRLASRAKSATHHARALLRKQRTHAQKSPIPERLRARAERVAPASHARLALDSDGRLDLGVDGGGFFRTIVAHENGARFVRAALLGEPAAGRARLAEACREGGS